MSPEQIRGEELDARTDLFSYGLVLHEMATGRPAFTGQTSGVILDGILNRAPVRLSCSECRSASRTGSHRLQGAREGSRGALSDGIGSASRPRTTESATSSSATRQPLRSRRPLVTSHAGRRGICDWARPQPSSLCWSPRVPGSTVARGTPGPPNRRRRRLRGPAVPESRRRSATTDFLQVRARRRGRRRAEPCVVARRSSVHDDQAIRRLGFRPPGCRPRAAGRQLVTGHFLREGDRLRITVEAIDVDSARVLWRDAVSVEANNLIGMQEQIATRVQQRLLPLIGARRVRSRLPRDPPTRRPTTCSCAALRRPYDPGPNKQAIAMLERSVGLDPTFGRAWAALGFATTTTAATRTVAQQAQQRSVAAYERALALDPTLIGDAAVPLVLRRAERGQLEAAYDMASALVERHPGNARAQFALGYVFRYAGMLEEAAARCDAALRTRRNRSPISIVRRGIHRSGQI